MITLTKTQYETLTYLKEYFKAHGYMPTHQEVAMKFGIQIGGSSSERFKQLEKKNAIKKTGGPRGYYITYNE